MGFTDDAKFKMVDSLLTTIDGDLRNRRNRAAHDLWVLGDATTERLKIGPKFYKEPHKARNVKFFDAVPMTDDDIRKLGNEIVIVCNA